MLATLVAIFVDGACPSNLETVDAWCLACALKMVSFSVLSFNHFQEVEKLTFNLRRLHVVHAVRAFLRFEFDSSGEIPKEPSIEGLSALNESELVMKHT